MKQWTYDMSLSHPTPIGVWCWSRCCDLQATRVCLIFSTFFSVEKLISKCFVNINFLASVSLPPSSTVLRLRLVDYHFITHSLIRLFTYLTYLSGPQFVYSCICTNTMRWLSYLSPTHHQQTTVSGKEAKRWIGKWEKERKKKCVNLLAANFFHYRICLILALSYAISAINSAGIYDPVKELWRVRDRSSSEWCCSRLLSLLVVSVDMVWHA